MALLTNKTEDNGITTTYHRISNIDTVVNCHNNIVILSYINQDYRQNEIKGKDVYKASTTYVTVYNDSMSVEDAYNYLKTMPQFAGSEDV